MPLAILAIAYTADEILLAENRSSIDARTMTLFTTHRFFPLEPRRTGSIYNCYSRLSRRLYVYQVTIALSFVRHALHALCAMPWDPASMAAFARAAAAAADLLICANFPSCARRAASYGRRLSLLRVYRGIVWKREIVGWLREARISRSSAFLRISGPVADDEQI